MVSFPRTREKALQRYNKFCIYASVRAFFLNFCKKLLNNLIGRHNYDKETIY